MPEEKVNWKDVEGFIKWFFEDNHQFDVDLTAFDNIEFHGFLNTATDKKYSARGLFDHWLTYIKDS